MHHRDRIQVMIGANFHAHLPGRSGIWRCFGTANLPVAVVVQAATTGDAGTGALVAHAAVCAAFLGVGLALVRRPLRELVVDVWTLRSERGKLKTS